VVALAQGCGTDSRRSGRDVSGAKKWISDKDPGENEENVIGELTAYH